MHTESLILNFEYYNNTSEIYLAGWQALGKVGGSNIGQKNN